MLRKVKTWKDRLRGHKDSVIFLQMPDGPDGVHLLSISADASLRLWDLKERVVRKKLELSHPKGSDSTGGPKGSIAIAPAAGVGFCTAFALTESALAHTGGDEENTPGPQAGFIYGGYDGGTIAEWEAENGDFVRDFSGHRNAISCIRTHTASGCLFTGSWDGTIRVWNIGQVPGVGGGAQAAAKHGGGECTFVFEFGLGNPVADFGFLGLTAPPAATGHAAGHHGKGTAHGAARQAGGHTARQQQDAAQAGPSLVTTACLDGNLRILDWPKKECKVMCEASSTAGLRCMCLREAQKNEDAQVFLGTDDCRISGWRIPANGPLQCINSWKAHGSEVTFLQHVGNRLFSGSEDGYIKVWEPKAAHLLDEMCGHEGGVLTFIVADKLIYSGSRDHSIRSWCMQEMEQRIWERNRMAEAEMASRRCEIYLGIMGTGKKKARPGKAAVQTGKKKGKK